MSFNRFQRSVSRLAVVVAPLAVALPLALALPAAAQDSERMDAVVSEEADTGAFMGTALVAIGDRIVFDEAYGSANLEWDIPNRTAGKFRVGSVTKQFTAAAILLLVEDGDIALDEPVNTYWADAPASWDAITVRHLLQHTSGIPNFTSFDEFRAFKFQPTTLAGAIATFTDRELEFTPGERWSYSNSGYLVLAQIVAEVSGQSLADFMQARIFTPLGMEETGVDTSGEILPLRVSGYSPSADGPINAEYVHMSIPQGGGNIYSTTHDLLKWQRGLFNGELLQAETLAEMTAPGVEAMGDATYGLGVLVTDNAEGRMVWHGGGIEGFNSMLMHDPDRDITVAVLANINGSQASDLAMRLMTLARGGEVVLASEVTIGSIDAASLEDFPGTYPLAPTFAIRIFVEGDQLKGQGTGQPAFDLDPIEGEADAFVITAVDARIAFWRDDNGTVTGLTLYQAGQALPGERQP